MNTTSASPEDAIASLTPAPRGRRRPQVSRLAPWQERKVARHIDDHLDRPISIRELAEIVGLSTNYFSRRFKGSFGVSPRAYMIRGRLDRAKTLMKQTRSSLCQIALASGFCDQAHMSRLFHAVVGSTPKRWRCEQTSALAPSIRPRPGRPALRA